MNDESEETCFLTPGDDASMLDPPVDRPVGPEWWEGRWPHGGIGSPADLERWVDGRLNEVISMLRSYPDSLGGIALDLGRQAVENATRHLARCGGGDYPPRPQADQLMDFVGVQNALEALLRHLKRELAPTSGASNNPLARPWTATTPVAARALDGDAARVLADQAPSAETFVIDQGTFTVRWHDRTCQLGNTIPFRLLVRLAHRPGVFLHINRLIDSIWPERDPEKNTVQKTVGNLRKRLRDAGMGDLISVQPAHYALSLPDGTPARIASDGAFDRS